MESKFTNYVVRKIAEFGDKFSTSDLSMQFVPAFNSGKRIKVKFSTGEIKSGTIGVSTGWKPIFLLMLTKRSTGSSYTLTDKDIIIK